jgi:hypothetical protein
MLEVYHPSFSEMRNRLREAAKMEELGLPCLVVDRKQPNPGIFPS